MDANAAFIVMCILIGIILFPTIGIILFMFICECVFTIVAVFTPSSYESKEDASTNKNSDWSLPKKDN